MCCAVLVIAMINEHSTTAYNMHMLCACLVDDIQVLAMSMSYAYIYNYNFEFTFVALYVFVLNNECV